MDIQRFGVKVDTGRRGKEGRSGNGAKRREKVRVMMTAVEYGYGAFANSTSSGFGILKKMALLILWVPTQKWLEASSTTLETNERMKNRSWPEIEELEEEKETQLSHHLVFASNMGPQGS
ncbi:hypothetical protein Ancab_029834 [Ancistrocladus abbreviatus]